MLTVPCSQGVLSFWKVNGSQYIYLLEKYLGMELKDLGFSMLFHRSWILYSFALCSKFPTRVF